MEVIKSNIQNEKEKVELTSVEIDEFNEIRLETGRVFIYFLSFTNMFWQARVSLNPSSEQHRLVNNCYWLIWLVVIIFIILSHVKSTKFIKPAYCLIFVRNALRVFDFEQSRYTLTQVDFLGLLGQQLLALMLIIIIIIETF
jgi:hypothetical protein